MDEAHEQKCAKYQGLSDQHKGQGWTTLCEQFEVGAQALWAGKLDNISQRWKNQRKSKERH